MPCGDNCGVSINWHLFTDYNRGWSARVTVFNWDEIAFPDWFAAIQLDKAAAGFEAMYSFNGTILPDSKNNTIIMQGLPGLNYLVPETDAVDPAKNPRIPGKQQSVVSFTKKGISGLNIPAGDGFPTKVFFNGEECSLPTIYPTSNSNRIGSAMILSVLIAAVVFMLMQQ
ncbi:COBRA-like protein-7 precursor [Euphorbia peplus]|nr:COBRA-like protein-7 precursor [Euphorbia peplus]